MRYSLITVLVLAFVASAASAQMQPSGQFTPGHTVRVLNSGGTAVGDGGGAAGSATLGNGYLTELGITNTGTPFCINDALTSSVGGYHQFCVGANALGGGLLSYNAYGGAAALGLTININGASYGFPASGAGLGNVTGPTGSTVGDLALFNNTTGTLIRDGGPPAGTILNIAALRLMSVGLNNVLVAGYTTSGDGGGGTFNYNPLDTASSDNNCTIIKDAANRRWYRNLNGGPITPLMCGAAGNGTADDTTYVQYAATAAQNGWLYLGPNCYKISATITWTSEKFSGAGPNTNSCLVAGVTNLTFLAPTGGGNIISGFYIAAAAAGANTSGTAIALPVQNPVGSGPQVNNLVEDVVINEPCFGVDVNGNQVHLNRIRIDFTQGAGCDGIRVGNLSTNGRTTSFLSNVTVAQSTGNPPDAGILVLDNGGGTWDAVSSLFGTVGTYIHPGANQVVEWSFFQNSSLGDTDAGDALLIDTQTTSSVIKGNHFTQTWTANSSGGNGVHIKNTGLGLVTGTSFVGHRSYGNANTGMVIETNVLDTSFQDGRICGNAVALANTANGVLLENTVGVILTGNRIASACDGLSAAPQASAVSFFGTNAGVTVANNDVSGGGSVSIFSGTPGSGVVGPNTGIDNVIPTVASAATIMAPFNPVFIVSGSTAVSTINGFWTGRNSISMITSSGALVFNTGGNICNSVTSAGANATVSGLWDAAATCWSLK